MASFLAQPTQFTPYIPKYDVALYGQVGQVKQQTYNQGLQQAQSYIENVAGIQVGPQVDKQYLQEKLADATAKANQLGGADFSDQSIVGKIGTYAASVANDSVILNAAAATAQYKKESTLRDNFRKEGKDDPANSYAFDKQAAAWMNSSTPGSSFNGKYVPYRDVSKKVLDAIKAVDPNSSLTQMPYQTDANGNYIKDSVTGQPLLNTAIIEKYYKGKDKEKILAAIEGSLDSGDYQQLAMTGAYNLKDANPEQLANHVTNVYTTATRQLSDKQQALNIEYISEKDPDRKREIVRQLADIDQNLSTLSQKHTSDMSSIITNPDGIRSNIYMQGWKNNLVNGFSSTESWTKYTDNPLYKAQWEQEKYVNENKKWDAEFKLKQAKDQRESSQFALEAAGLWNPSGKKKGSTPEGGIAGTTTIGDKIMAPIKTETDPLFYENQIVSEQDSAIEQRKGINKEFAITALQSTPWGQGKTIEEIERGVAERARLDGTDVSDYYNKWAHKFTESYRADKTNIPFAYRDKFKQLDQLNTEIENNHLILTNADKKFGTSIQSVMNVIPKTVNISVTSGTGTKPLSLSQSDLTDFAQVAANRQINSIAGSSFGPTVNDVLEKQGEAAKKRLVDKYGKANFDSIISGLRGEGYSEGTDVAAIPNEILSTFNSKLVPAFTDPTRLQKQKERSEWFRNNSAVAQPYTQPVYRPNGEGKDEVNTQLMIMAERSKTAGGNTNPEFDLEDVKKAITEDNSRIALQILPPSGPNGQYKYELQIIREDGNTRKMDITQEDAITLTGQQYNYNTNPVVKRIQYNSGNKGTHTNYNYSPYSEDAWKSPYYTQDKFNTQKYVVSADVMRTNTDDYDVILHVKEKGTDQFTNITIPNHFTPNQIDAAIAAVNDGLIDNLKKDDNAR